MSQNSKMLTVGFKVIIKTFFFINKPQAEQRANVKIKMLSHRVAPATPGMGLETFYSRTEPPSERRG